MNRPAYNKLQAEARKQQAETLRRFKEQNPERYTELLERAKEELNEEASTTPTIVFTGELSITRDKASRLAENVGYKVGKHVSKNTTYVIVGESPGSKYQKAIQLGTSILDEEEFNTLLKGEKPSYTKTTTNTCKKCGHRLSEQMGGFAQIWGGFTCSQCHTINRF